MKNILSCCLLFVFASCSDAFINHKLQYEKTGACGNEENIPVKMLSNINGERYEFMSCLDENFDGENYLVERKGDSIVVSFSPAKEKGALFKITLDIDAKPAYKHIVLDGRDVSIKQYH
jgi:hypothetical protein